MSGHPGRLYLVDGGATLKPFIAETDPARVDASVRADFRARAQAILAGGAVAFGEMIALHFCLGPTHSYQHTPADHPLFLLLAEIAAERNVPIDIHMEAVAAERETPPGLLRACAKNPERLPASLPAFERLLAHRRDARIVWQHVGWDNLGEATVDLYRRLMSKHPNLHLSLRVELRREQVGTRGMPMPNRIVDDAGAVLPEWLALLREFSDRVMIGADEFVGPSGGLTTEPNASFRTTWDMLEQLPEDLRNKIGRENAIRVYRLE
jgi:predicted TIM-barrel fold metal-dependent hydrolase